MRYRGTQPSPFAAPEPPPPPAPRPPPRKRCPPLTRAQKAHIFRRAASGMSPAAIGRATGIPRERVSRVLRRAGKLPPPSGPGGRPRALTDEQASEAAARKAAGETWQAIAASCGADVTTVKRAIARLERESAGR
jgi:DNA invertase Pin-like site-specific DNA recombinase